jgi:hypothetical protein
MGKKGGNQMKNYRMNAVMAGVLYFLGSAFGVASTAVGGKVISSIVINKPIPPRLLVVHF